MNTKHKAIILLSCLMLCLLAPGVSANVLSITPASAQHQTGETQSYDVILDTAPEALSGFNITIQIENSAIAEITGVSFPAWASPKSNGTVPSSVVWCKGIDLAGQSGAQNIILCTVTIRAKGTGTTNINLVSVKIDDTVGGRYDPSLVPSVLTVGGTSQIATIGMYRNGVYYLRNTNTAGNADLAFTYGSTGDIPVTGDWNNDGIDTVGMYRNGVYYLRNTNDAGYADLAFTYGTTGDIPVTGDWDGDGIDTVGMYRNGVFYLRNTNTAGNADLTFTYGTTGDIPVTGDWNGDGIDTVGMYRNGVYYLRNTNTAGNANLAFTYGMQGDIPVTGDWTGKGYTTIGMYRGGTYYLRNTNTAGNADLAFTYGTTGDIPVTGKWV